MSTFISFVILVVLASVLYRWSIAQNSYSGQGVPVKFGDYEAQRHWMEITYNLKVSDWYENTTDNDLSYWGLDYPPLTAYHSYFMGYIANKIDKKFVKLHESKGIESEEHKLFMRSTVLAFDLLIFYPSVLLILKEIFFRSNNNNDEISKSNKSNITTTNAKSNIKLNSKQKDYLISLLLILLNPTIVLIDHGHFQYNSISLGLMQLSIYFILLYTSCESTKTKFKNLFDLVLCSLLFSLALNYKQMELYHALPIFFYLLGLCIKSNIFTSGFVKLIFIGSTVILTFIILWLPFISHGLDSVVQVLNRIFPIKRGLFEDKVANFWCSISVVVKIKEKFSTEFLAKISFLLTLMSNLPSSIDLLLRPSRQKFMLALVNSALGFYLFSFHVHEKSIIISTVPACLLIHFYPMLVTWFILISNISMLPLLIRDGLTVPTITTSLLYFIIVYICYQSNEIQNENNFWLCLKPFTNIFPKSAEKYSQILLKYLYFISLTGAVILSILALCVKPPKNLPDLWTVLICVYSFVHFIAFAILFNLIQLTLKTNDLFLNKEQVEHLKRRHLLLFNFESSFTQVVHNRKLKKLN